MYCSDCENLNTEKKKDGSTGCLYYCKKLNKMVPGNYGCDKFSKSYSRKYWDKDKIYNEGRKYSEEAKGNPALLLFLLILLVILGLIFGVFKI